MLEFLIWLCIGFIGYTYLGYPLVLWVLTRFGRARSLAGAASLEALPKPDALPPLSVVICAHNEQQRIGHKIKNLQSLYPLDKLSIYVVDDASNDQTAAEAESFSGVSVIRQTEQQGKPAGLNRALESVDTEYVLFCDVRQQITPHSIERLLLAMRPPEVGAAFAELVIVDEHSHEQVSIGLYWRYEKWIRQMESRWSSTVGVTGACYLIRRQDFEPFHPDIVLDDVELPVRLLRKGLMSRLVEGASMLDPAQSDMSAEKKRKVRTLAGNFQLLERHPWLLQLGGYPCSWQFLSHKVFRLLVPFVAMLLLLALFLAQGVGYQLLLMVYLLALGLGLASIGLPALKRIPLISTWIVFMQMNGAIVEGAWRWWRGELSARWKS